MLKSAAHGDCWETGALAKATSLDMAVPAPSKGRLIRDSVKEGGKPPHAFGKYQLLA
jgi:hypothetical protein